MTPRKPMRTQQEKNELIRISFEVSAEVRKKFKAKLAAEGKTLKDVFVDFMKEYIKK